MGHTKAEQLKDLKSELEAISRLDGMKQKSPGIFYLKSTSFHHFHDKDGKRWADVKTPTGDWESIAIDFNASEKDKTAFMKAAKMAHQKLKGSR